MRKENTKSELLSHPVVKPGDHECNRKGLLLLGNIGPICRLYGVNKIQEAAIISSLFTMLFRLKV